MGSFLTRLWFDHTLGRGSAHHVPNHSDSESSSLCDSIDTCSTLDSVSLSAALEWNGNFPVSHSNYLSALQGPSPCHITAIKKLNQDLLLRWV